MWKGWKFIAETSCVNSGSLKRKQRKIEMKILSWNGWIGLCNLSYLPQHETDENRIVSWFACKESLCWDPGAPHLQGKQKHYLTEIFADYTIANNSPTSYWPPVITWNSNVTDWFFTTYKKAQEIMEIFLTQFSTKKNRKNLRLGKNILYYCLVIRMLTLLM